MIIITGDLNLIMCSKWGVWNVVKFTSDNKKRLIRGCPELLTALKLIKVSLRLSTFKVCLCCAVEWENINKKLIFNFRKCSVIWTKQTSKLERSSQSLSSCHLRSSRIQGDTNFYVGDLWRCHSSKHFSLHFKNSFPIEAGVAVFWSWYS